MNDEPKNQPAVVVADGGAIKILDPATYVAGVFAEHRTKLDALKEADKAVTYDIQTTAGLALAKASRMSAVRVRTGIEEQRKFFKAPLLAAGKQLDEVAKTLTAEIQPLEDRHGVAIAAEEQRLEAIRAAKAEEERLRVAALEAKVQAIRTLPDSALMLGSEQIAGMLDGLQARVLTLDEFAELTGQALAAQSAATLRLADLHQAALAREAEALRLEEERQKMQRERDAQALRDNQEAEERRQREEQERIAREAEQAAEKKRQAEEAERLRQERQKLAAEQVEFQRQQDELARQRADLQALIDSAVRKPDPEPVALLVTVAETPVAELASAEFVEDQPPESAPPAKTVLTWPHSAYDCLRQWAAAERYNDASELANAREQRDAILAVLDDMGEIK